mmetsp:Transcript_7095/g.16605  ORF Transcript_7095/g.16605 Transcript_7095/m.16605 type:complete len:265 (-) Transcript_7095:279-1073(-)|eukprot:CAMPEP_0113635046 /NCGR_PEP_ID=MMETSP0017_2-20120614/18258_1 /TAXON_ID=2856 /ORGANISM="Cylindrotheca closterium" /LENGTH=264 /DNA_ID=CAMNT_0000545789 /DNA_START=42 /DNA_END=836 /DNA_ORIENTATION=- /assembly_acc=CAM_ASM_000147
MTNTANNKLRKRVSFVSSPQSPLNSVTESADQQQEEDQQHVSSHSCHYYCDGLAKDERRAVCWYSVEDLQACREEAKNTIQQLQGRLEQGTLDSIPDHVCLRGIEKYADAAGKYRKQRIYIESILQQQRALQEQQRILKNNTDAVENLANLSRYLSQASTELALFYAGRCAAELSLLRHEEEDEEEDDEEYYDEEEEGEEKYHGDSSSTCSSEIDVHESKANTEQLCCGAEPNTIDTVSSKRKRSRCHSFGEMSMPPRKIQCCE